MESLLAELHPLEAPDVSNVPAAGWWLVLLAVVICLVILVFLIRRYLRRRWLRDAKIEFDAIRALPVDSDAREFLSALSRLLRRVLIKRESRAAVASLQGDEWLARLDALLGDSTFRSELGPLLSEGPYRRSMTMTVDDREALIKASAELIRRAAKSDA